MPSIEINSVSLVYILTHLGKRVVDFFHHWYIDAFIIATHWAYNLLERLDRIFALRITAKNWFQPLYQDYTVIGYMWGFVFRTFRIIMGIVVYVFFIVASLALYLFWAAVPLFVIYQIVANF
jgi:hypothetical protein